MRLGIKLDGAKRSVVTLLLLCLAITALSHCPMSSLLVHINEPNLYHEKFKYLDQWMSKSTIIPLKKAKVDLKVFQLLYHNTQFTLVNRPGCVSIKIVAKIGAISDIQADVLPMASSATGQADVGGEVGAGDDA